MCTSPLIMVKKTYKTVFDDGEVKKLGETNKIFHLHPGEDLSGFIKSHHFRGDDVFLVPCGSCAECVLKYRKEWSVRCAAEALYYVQNCFVTLTYDDDHYKGPNKKDLQDFLQHLRNWKIKCRYFACGERGETFGRFHYHLILFGYMPSDLKYHSQSKSGENMYTSEFLEKIWDKGFVKVQDFTPKCGQYVAGYVSKKLDKDSFLMMSTHPGLAYQFYQDHKLSILNFDKLYLNIDPSGNSVPRYFVKLLEKEGFDLNKFKIGRIAKATNLLYELARNHGFDFIDENFKYKAHFAENKLHKLRRSYAGNY